MKFLIDECMSSGVASLLLDSGWDAIHVSDRQLLGKPDAEVLACAHSEDRVLISADTDFGELLVKSGAYWPSVIILRRSSHVATNQASVLSDNLPGLIEDLSAGAIIVITDDRIRVRPLTRH